MSYYFAKKINDSFENALARTTAALENHGFGIITEIDFTKTIKNKLGVDVRPYRILGACNPNFALKAVTAEPHIGLMLPCNVIVQQLPEGGMEVSAIDPVASMSAVSNLSLSEIANEVRERLKTAIESL